jgi:hypothetical protein
MLSSISWSQFLTAIIILLISYYCIIAGLYYRIEIFSLFKTNPVKPNPTDLPMEINTANEKQDLFSNEKIKLLMQELNSLLMAAVKTKTIREELIMALQMLFRDYSDLKDQPITSELNQLIKNECKNICSITLSDVELKMLWNG